MIGVNAMRLLVEAGWTAQQLLALAEAMAADAALCCAEADQDGDRDDAPARATPPAAVPRWRENKRRADRARYHAKRQAYAKFANRIGQDISERISEIGECIGEDIGEIGECIGENEAQTTSPAIIASKTSVLSHSAPAAPIGEGISEGIGEIGEGQVLPLIPPLSPPDPQIPPPISPPIPGRAGAKSRGQTSRLPDDWQPAAFGVDSQCRHIVDGWPPGRLEREVERFRANHESRGTRMVNWQSAWKTWVLNSDEFDSNRRGPRHHHSHHGGGQPANPMVRAGIEREAAFRFGE